MHFMKLEDLNNQFALPLEMTVFSHLCEGVTEILSTEISDSQNSNLLPEC